MREEVPIENPDGLDSLGAALVSLHTVQSRLSGHIKKKRQKRKRVSLYLVAGGKIERSAPTV